MTETELKSNKAYRNYVQSILFLIIMLAVFELCNAALNIVLIVQQSEQGKTRAQVTRSVVVATGYCLKQRDINTQKEIADCVEKVLGRPLEDKNESK